MNRPAVILSSIALCACLGGYTPTVKATASKSNATTAKVPVYAQKVINTYPDFKLRYENNHLVFPDGTKIVYDDGRKKNFAQRLDDCDVQDMFFSAYDRNSTTPIYLVDCGRGRCEALFKKMYGSSATEVKKHLVYVDWFGEKVQFTSVNGADKQLRKVAQELASKPALKKYLKSSGTFYWRTVRGANRQSAHSYGIAFDIGVQYSNYWLWTNPGAKETDHIKYANRIPMEIVNVFERHGFIWGGRWYHYDTMHFEYRPELL